MSNEDLPRPALPFGEFYVHERMQRGGIIELSVQENTHGLRIWTTNIVDMAARGAQGRLKRLRRRFEREAARRNRALEKAKAALAEKEQP